MGFITKKLELDIRFEQMCEFIFPYLSRQKITELVLINKQFQQKFRRKQKFIKHLQKRSKFNQIWTESLKHLQITEKDMSTHVSTTDNICLLTSIRMGENLKMKFKFYTHDDFDGENFLVGFFEWRKDQSSMGDWVSDVEQFENKSQALGGDCQVTCASNLEHQNAWSNQEMHDQFWKEEEQVEVILDCSNCTMLFTNARKQEIAFTGVKSFFADHYQQFGFMVWNKKNIEIQEFEFI